MDGYNKTNRLLKLKQCASRQSSFNARIKEINKELSELPQMPYSLDFWIDSLPDLHGKGFTMKSYSKFSSIKKEYEEIIESSEDNLREMKILAIEDLLEKIDSINENVASES